MSFCGTVAIFIPASDVKNVHATLALRIHEKFCGCLVCLAPKFKRTSLSFDCESIYQVTHERCTKSRLEQVSSELRS